MSTTITNPATGQPVSVFVRLSGGYVDCILRADTQAAWEAAALAQNVLVKQPDGSLVPNAGISIDVLGPVVKVPAVIDPATLTVTTPAVMDERYHVNMRLDPRAEGVAKSWEDLAIQWTEHGTLDPEVNNDEVAHVLGGVGLIDPDTIRQPKRVWA